MVVDCVLDARERMNEKVSCGRGLAAPTGERGLSRGRDIAKGARREHRTPQPTSSGLGSRPVELGLFSRAELVHPSLGLVVMTTNHAPAEPSDCNDCSEGPRLPRHVRLATGELFWQQEDIRIAGRGLHFALIRTYRSPQGRCPALG